jgi:hypothetical protein
MKMTHKVVIELEFNNVPAGKKVLNCDVHDYLEQLIDDNSLDYTVIDSNGQEYGVIDWKEIIHRT